MTLETLSFERVGLARKVQLDTLRERCAAMLDWPVDEIVLLPSPELVQLLSQSGAEFEQIGPVEAPVTAVRAARDSQLAEFERSLCDDLTAAGLRALSGISVIQKGQQNNALNRKVQSLNQSLLQLDCVSGASWNGRDLRVELQDVSAFDRAMKVRGIEVPVANDCAVFSGLSLDDVQCLLQRLAPHGDRSAQVRRTTKETDILVNLDLDRGGPVCLDTGIEFFDHMLEQIAKHGGFSLEITCRGDLDVDGHHTIEDVSLALGAALAQALGDRSGIGRYGFELPMDEARAGVWLDLSGRPFSRFEGQIPGEHVGAFPVEMTPHVFRSLADSLKAAVHVTVTGDNAHHMIEACFKAFGRALRQAITVKGDAIPSTKGVL